jgi:hypothetical protein
MITLKALPINLHDHFFWNILFTAEEERWFGDFGITIFLFFKILIANQDMHVFQYFYILKMYPCFCIYLYVFLTE